MPPVSIAAFLDNLFVKTVTTDPVYFFSVAFTVVVSVTLHELGHAVAAIRQGDDTPRLAGRLTLDPMKHMGPMSIVILLVAGIAWGSTPVNPAKFRSRYGDAIVSLAGPAVTVGLALIGLTALGLWMRAAPTVASPAVGNLRIFLLVFGTTNILLCVFNLLPVPPLDGSHIVASFVPPFKRLLADPNNQGMFFVLLIALFFAAPHLWHAADVVSIHYLGWVSGVPLGAG